MQERLLITCRGSMFVNMLKVRLLHTSQVQKVDGSLWNKEFGITIAKFILGQPKGVGHNDSGILAGSLSYSEGLI
jgi:hypothetical protein